MGFLKKAHGTLLRPDITPEVWGNFQVRTAHISAKGSTDLIAQASQLFERPFNPADYLLSHVTIVASVDTYEPQGAQVGTYYEGGFKVNRKFANHRITTDTQQWVNNNKDAWDRPVILASHRTFVGAHNWVEHVQIEDLSKGRVVDAVARDIGPSVYVDILVATDRKHQDLIRSIKTGSLNTLSMGCTVDATQCTKCGHWAHDETEMCPCVRYQKGNTFFDNQGRRHIVAELCGHYTIDPTGGVRFIDASWVQVPAFTGAVLRNIVEPTPEISTRVAEALSRPAPEWSLADQRKVAQVVGTVEGSNALHRTQPVPYSPWSLQPELGSRYAASVPLGWNAELQIGNRASCEVSPFLQQELNTYFGCRHAQWDDPGGGFGDLGDGGEEEEKDPFRDTMDEVEKHLLDQVKKRLMERIQTDDVGKELSPEQSSAQPNDNVAKWASRTHMAAWRAISASSASGAALMNALASYNQTVGIHVPVETYRAALLVGPRTKYASLNRFVAACGQALGRKASVPELKQLLALSTLLSTRRTKPSASTTDGGH